ncbi:MAG: hypothetical protein HC893_10195 [Chloroflexaceae bacterium]|nr:hypothetical protein [Chloroflexaceae bacterium]NJL34151.1 hypothetical protein [Chloroflexaceae bacterium]NJO04482.1 hypothetical protein [Chloroflexaceae bacterium]
MSTQARRQRRRSARTTQQRREQQRAQLAAINEPVDYSQDYNYIRHDLIRITIWSVLLFALLIGLSFFL